jgi:hypothetical protein
MTQARIRINGEKRIKWEMWEHGETNKKEINLPPFILKWCSEITSRKTNSCFSEKHMPAEWMLLNFTLWHSPQGCLSLLNSGQGTLLFRRQKTCSRCMVYAGQAPTKIHDVAKFIFSASPCLIFGPVFWSKFSLHHQDERVCKRNGKAWWTCGPLALPYSLLPPFPTPHHENTF